VLCEAQIGRARRMTNHTSAYLALTPLDFGEAQWTSCEHVHATLLSVSCNLIVSLLEIQEGDFVV
jgi:hypothetical protein